MSKLVTATEAARLLHKSDKTIRDWLHKNRFPNAKIVKRNGLRQWAIPLDDVKLVQQEEATESYRDIPEPLDRFEALERRIEALERAMLSKTTGILPVVPKLPEELHKIVLHKQSGDDLPPGFVPLADFYHGINHNTLYRRIRDGVIAVTYGHWKHSGHAVEKALSPEQQALFYHQMNKHPSFVACPACPH